MPTSKLMRVQRLDSIKLDDTYYTDEGYLMDHPVVTSVGIFEYTNEDGSTRRELRLPEEVFAEASLKSYRGKPIIITHDAGYVDKTNVRAEQIGTILTEGQQDGEDVRAEIVIHDTDSMNKSHLRELSLGYNLRLDETPGEWNGAHYDAIQRDIQINHLALVLNARAGEQARLNIDGRENTTLKGAKITMRKKTKRQDGGLMSPEEMAIAIEAFQQRRAERMGAEPDPGPDAVDNEEPDAVGAAVDNEEPDVVDELDTVQLVKDRRDRRDAEGDPEDVEGAMGIIAQQDEDIDTLLGVIDVLTGPDGGVLLVDDEDEENTDEDEENTDEDEENTDEEEENSDEEENPVRSDRRDRRDRRDARDDFREMLRVVRIGDRLHMDGLETLSVKSAKKAILKKLKPSLRLDGKSYAYVNAAFDMAVNDLKTRKDTNYQRKQMTSRRDSANTRKAVGSAMDARQRMIDKRMKKEGK